MDFQKFRLLLHMESESTFLEILIGGKYENRYQKKTRGQL